MNKENAMRPGDLKLHDAVRIVNGNKAQDATFEGEKDGFYEFKIQRKIPLTSISVPVTARLSQEDVLVKVEPRADCSSFQYR